MLLLSRWNAFVQQDGDRESRRHGRASSLTRPLRGGQYVPQVMHLLGPVKPWVDR
jgi:hypothetical protein